MFLIFVYAVVDDEIEFKNKSLETVLTKFTYNLYLY